GTPLAPHPRPGPGRGRRGARARRQSGRSGRRARRAPTPPTGRPGGRGPRRRDGRAGEPLHSIFARRGPPVQGLTQTGEPVRRLGRISADRIPHGGGGRQGGAPDMERLSRRSFVKIAGAATGAAAIAAAPPVARAAIGEEGAVKTDPTTGVPEEPLVAYVRDAKRGEVT